VFCNNMMLQYIAMQMFHNYFFHHLTQNTSKGNRSKVCNVGCNPFIFVHRGYVWAFPNIWKLSILYKLRKIGIDGNLLSWVTDYLDDRKQKVVLDGLAIGRKFVMSDATPLFLYTGVTCERFQIYGSCPHCNDWLNNNVRGETRHWETLRKILGATPSGPLGLELFSISNWSFTSCSVINNQDKYCHGQSLHSGDLVHFQYLKYRHYKLSTYCPYLCSV
jgi:hypothetical protein